MTVTIARERPDTPDGIALLKSMEHYYATTYAEYHAEVVSANQLVAQHVAFYVVREHDVAAACGGVKMFNDYGELKRIFVRPDFRGRSYGRLIVERLEAHVRAHIIDTVRLETGVRQPEAIGMYERMGYRRIPPYGNHSDHELSVYMEKSCKLHRCMRMPPFLCNFFILFSVKIRYSKASV